MAVRRYTPSGLAGAPVDQVVPVRRREHRLERVTVEHNGVDCVVQEAQQISERLGPVARRIGQRQVAEEGRRLPQPLAQLGNGRLAEPRSRLVGHVAQCGGDP